MARRKYGPWTPEEDSAVVGAGKPRDIANRLGRTYAAMMMRRYKLRHPEPNARERAGWTAAKAKRLKLEYPTIENPRDLVALFGAEFTYGQSRTTVKRP